MIDLELAKESAPRTVALIKQLLKADVVGNYRGNAERQCNALAEHAFTLERELAQAARRVEVAEDEVGRLATALTNAGGLRALLVMSADEIKEAIERMKERGMAMSALTLMYQRIVTALAQAPEGANKFQAGRVAVASEPGPGGESRALPNDNPITCNQCGRAQWTRSAGVRCCWYECDGITEFRTAPGEALEGTAPEVEWYRQQRLGVQLGSWTSFLAGWNAAAGAAALRESSGELHTDKPPHGSYWGGNPGFSEFTCPECGGHRFGSSTHTEPWEGHCNGWIDVPGTDGQGATRRCNFTWPRTEDRKYFGPRTPSGVLRNGEPDAPPVVGTR